MKFITSNYGKQIKELRIKLNITQKEFGHAVGVSANCVKWWENGRTVPLRKSFK